MSNTMSWVLTRLPGWLFFWLDICTSLSSLLPSDTFLISAYSFLLPSPPLEHLYRLFWAELQELSIEERGYEGTKDETRKRERER